MESRAEGFPEEEIVQTVEAVDNQDVAAGMKFRAVGPTNTTEGQTRLFVVRKTVMTKRGLWAICDEVVTTNGSVKTTRTELPFIAENLLDTNNFALESEAL